MNGRPRLENAITCLKNLNDQLFQALPTRTASSLGNEISAYYEWSWKKTHSQRKERKIRSVSTQQKPMRFSLRDVLFWPNTWNHAISLFPPFNPFTTVFLIIFACPLTILTIRLTGFITQKHFVTCHLVSLTFLNWTNTPSALIQMYCSVENHCSSIWQTFC